MWGWLRELKEIRGMKPECASCEVLKVELSRERLEKEMLLKHVLTPQVQSVPEPSGPPQPIPMKHVPWKVRQQMLEEADREKARILQEFKKRDAEARKPETSELEKTFGVVEEK